ncbi:MAG TPA: carbohydrate ABC transporter permease [Caldilineaceae bacterium]|nr:carbohydrate ABC transporter permease [Caldilineaceae bacterium]
MSAGNVKSVDQPTAVPQRPLLAVENRDLWRTVTYRLLRVLLYLSLIGVGITMLLPLLWMISTSLKQPGEVFLLPPKWIPNPPQWGNYVKLFEVLPFGRFLLNSLKISGLATLGALISCSMAAFAFARMNFPGRNILFAIILATLMIPYHVTLIPLFALYKNMGWLSTHLPLTVPYFFGTAFGIFLIRQFFLTIPQELMDAARIDGCSFIQIYYKIFLPLAKPAMATLGIFTFLGSWNNLIGPLIFLNEVSTMTLTLGLTLLTTQSNGRWELIQAGAVISVIPMIIIFLVGQEHFIQGIARTGLKG